MKLSMPKRHKLDYDSEELAHNLKQSIGHGQGVDAFFSPPSPTKETGSDRKTKEKQVGANVQARKRARTHAPMHAETDIPKGARKHASVHARTEEELRKATSIKKHLSSFTFRFRLEELEKLDELTAKINQDAEQKISKNDIVRLALNWLIKDHEENKGKSMLVRVLRRT